MVDPKIQSWAGGIITADALDATTLGSGSSFPASWNVDRLFYRTDTSIMYTNTGTYGSPVWSSPVAAANEMVITHDTTESNHTYATTATGSTGIVGTIDVTNETNGGGGGGTVNQSFERIMHGAANITGNISGTISVSYRFQLWHNTYGNARQLQIRIKNSGGSVIASVGTPQYNLPHQHVETHDITFTNLTDVASVHLSGYVDGQSGCYTNGVSFTGTRETSVSPTELTNNTNSSAYTTLNAVGNYAVLDYGSSSTIASVSLKPTSAMTETVLQIQTSEDNSNWTTKRTILTSALTDDVFNYIRMPVTTARYVKILGASGLSKAISFHEVKVKVNVTDETLLKTHSHTSLSPTDSSVSLSGE